MAAPRSASPKNAPAPRKLLGRPQGSFTQHRRLDALLQLLHQHPNGLTLYEMSERLRVTTRSLRRYLLEVQRVTELERAPAKGRGAQRWLIPAAERPRSVQLRRTQAYALLAARNVFEPLRGSSLFEEIDLAAQRLLAVARMPGRGPNAGVGDGRLEERFVYVPFAPKDYATHAEAIDEVFQAVANNRPLSFRFPRPSDGSAERTAIHPYAMVLYKDEIFCLGKDLATSLIRTFALDRMRDVAAVAGTPFELPRRFDLAAYCQGQFGLGPMEDGTDIAIDFEPQVADYVRSRQLHRTQRVENLADGRIRLHLRVGAMAELATWVLGFGAMARVVAPEELSERVRSELERTLARYAPSSRAKRPRRLQKPGTGEVEAATTSGRAR